MLSSSIVNSLRFAVNKATVDNYQTPFFSPKDIGANVYSYDPGYMVLNVSPAASHLYPANQARAFFDNDTYQLGEDLTVVQRRPPVRPRRQHAVLEGPLHVDVARQRQLDHQRLGDRARHSRTFSSAV